MERKEIVSLEVTARLALEAKWSFVDTSLTLRGKMAKKKASKASSSKKTKKKSSKKKMGSCGSCR